MSDDINYCNCAAHSCPMLGVMSRSTTGSKEWYCGIHFGAPANRWGQITDELNRLGWLVTITRNLRAATVQNVQAVIKAAHKEIALNQSGHLRMSDNEDAHRWLIRLEDTLFHACQDRQQELQPAAEPQGENSAA